MVSYATEEIARLGVTGKALLLQRCMDLQGRQKERGGGQASVRGSLAELRFAVGVRAAPIAGHVGDGNFHCIAVLDPSNEDERRRVKELAENLAMQVPWSCVAPSSPRPSSSRGALPLARARCSLSVSP
jgi:hypothetical protein